VAQGGGGGGGEGGAWRDGARADARAATERVCGHGESRGLLSKSDSSKKTNSASRAVTMTHAGVAILDCKKQRNTHQTQRG